MSGKSDKGWHIIERRERGKLVRVIQYKDAAGEWKQHRVPADIRNARDAERYASAWVPATLESNAPAQSATSSTVTLGAYFEAWLARREKNPKIRHTTLRNNRGHIEHHIVPELGSKRLSELTPMLLRDYVAGLRTKRSAKGERVAPYTVRNVTATLRAALDEAFDEGLLPANPMRSKLVSRELPKAETRAGRNVIVHLAKPEAERLLACAAVPEERRARYLLAFTSGMRDGEIAALTWADIVSDHEVAHVDVTKSLDTDWKMAPPKTENGYRKLPLHPLALEALASWKANGFVRLVGRHARDTDPVFPSDKGKHHRPKSAELLRDDLAAAGCATKHAGHLVEFRGLRRSFATWLAEADVQDELRKRLMGHGASGVTDAHYTAKTLARLREAVLCITLDVAPRDAAQGPKASGNGGGEPPRSNGAAASSNGAARTAAHTAIHTARHAADGPELAGCTRPSPRNSASFRAWKRVARWCGPRSSKPLEGGSAVFGGFDSHALPLGWVCDRGGRSKGCGFTAGVR